MMNTVQLQNVENPFKDTLADGSSPEPKVESEESELFEEIKPNTVQGLAQSELLPVTV
jgi:hypothetical protein